MPVTPDRKLRWVSSTRGDPAALADLDRAMAAFYGTPERRELYQKMLASQEDGPLRPDSPGDRLLAAVVRSGARSVLEVGCGNGWLYRHLRSRGYAGAYTGLEVAEYVTAANRGRHPEARWETGSVYRLPLADASVGGCFAFYVLEHTVYPERALAEMLRVVRPGGWVGLAFPDFTAFGFLPSQRTGFTPGSARDKLGRRQWWDALVTLYDSRVRVRPAARRAAARFGPFPVNTRPLCLAHPELMWADIDAVYVAGRREVADWLSARGCTVEFPGGTDGEFAVNALVWARKPGG